MESLSESYGGESSLVKGKLRSNVTRVYNCLNNNYRSGRPKFFLPVPSILRKWNYFYVWCGRLSLDIRINKRVVKQYIRGMEEHLSPFQDSGKAMRNIMQC